MFWQFVREENISVALVSEYYDVNPPGWRCDSYKAGHYRGPKPGISLGDLEIGNGYLASPVEAYCVSIFATRYPLYLSLSSDDLLAISR